jgi:hypothetical protein
MKNLGEKVVDNAQQRSCQVSGDLARTVTAGSIVSKKLEAAGTLRRFDTKTSMTWPCRSTARYTYRHAPATFT